MVWFWKEWVGFFFEPNRIHINSHHNTADRQDSGHDLSYKISWAAVGKIIHINWCSPDFSQGYEPRFFPQVQSLPDVRMRLESRTTRSRSSGSLWYLGHQNQSNFLELESTKYVFLIDRRSFSCKVDFLKWVPFKNHLYWTCCLREFLGCCCCCCSVSRFFFGGETFQLFSCTFWWLALEWALERFFST